MLQINQPGQIGSNLMLSARTFFNYYLFYLFFFTIFFYYFQGKGKMNTYWLLGKQGCYVSEDNEVPFDPIPEFLHIMDPESESAV